MSTGLDLIPVKPTTAIVGASTPARFIRCRNRSVHRCGEGSPPRKPGNTSSGSRA